MLEKNNKMISEITKLVTKVKSILKFVDLNYIEGENLLF